MKNHLEDIVATLLAVVMVISLLIQVFFRFVLRNPIGWTEELAVTCFVMMVYIGAIGATRNDEHLKLELFINLCNDKGKQIMMIIGDFIFMAVSLILAYGVFNVAMNLKKYNMRTAMLGIPKWIPYIVLPVCFAFIAVRLAQNIKNRIGRLREIDADKREDRSDREGN